jgi:hypothetical protein
VQLDLKEDILEIFDLAEKLKFLKQDLNISVEN